MDLIKSHIIHFLPNAEASNFLAKSFLKFGPQDADRLKGVVLSHTPLPLLKKAIRVKARERKATELQASLPRLPMLAGLPKDVGANEVIYDHDIFQRGVPY